MPKSAIVVHTLESAGDILKQGGTQAWVADANRVGRCRYVVCTRNEAKAFGSMEPGGTAFLIGRIAPRATTVVPREPVPGRKRLKGVRINIVEFARIDVPKAWRPQQSPIAYEGDVEARFGIRLGDLTWIPVPAQ